MHSDAANLKFHKRLIREFLRTEVWTEEKLCALLAHAESRLSMWSCCCLIGCATADHPLRGKMPMPLWNTGHVDHILSAWASPVAVAAERAFCRLSDPLRSISDEADELRRRRIRPMIRRELRERSRNRDVAAQRVLAESHAPSFAIT